MLKIPLLSLLSVLLCLIGKPQSTLTFTASGGTLTTSSGHDASFTLPLTILFPIILNGQSIAIFDAQKHNVLTLNGAKFGTDIPRNLDGTNFIVTIGADRSIREVSNAPAINQDGFTIKVGNTFYGPFALASVVAPASPVQPNLPPTSYHPGYLFDDAYTIYNQISGATSMDPANLQAILSLYTIHDSNYKKNPFLVQILAPVFTAGTVRGGGMTPANFIGALGGTDITNLADGLAQFLMERFKEELSEAFFKKFKKDLEDPKFGDLKILFPKTFSTLGTIDQGIYQFSIYLESLRKSFITDLTNGYSNLNKLLQLQKYQQYFTNKFPAAGSVIYTALYFINAYKDNTNPGDALDRFSGVLNAGRPDIYFPVCVPAKCDDKQRALQTNLTGAVKMLQLLSFSLRSQSGKKYWVPADSLASLFSNETGLKIYLGLVWQELHYPTFKKPYSTISFQFDSAGTGTWKAAGLDALLSSAAASVDSIYAWKQFIMNFISKAEEISQDLTSLKGKKKADIDYNDYYRLYTASLDMLQQAAGFVDLPYVYIGDAAKEDFRTMSARIFYVTRSVGEFYVDIQSANYTSAVLNVIGILDTVLQYKDDVTNGYPVVRKGILKYGTFIATVAEAKSAKDVKNAISAVALPVGSFSIKQHSDFNISLNGYVGYAFDFASKFSSGIYAPVGVSFNWGVGPKKNGGAFTIFGSIFDVGAIVSYRLKDDTTSQLKQDVRLESIFSPSVQLMYEFPGIPLAVCAGWRLTPKLFYSNNQDFQVVSPHSVFNLSILVDIPLITIFNKAN
jgi:hypothetical protein